jgi:hypothetical protein
MSKSQTAPKPAWIKGLARFDRLVGSPIVGRPEGRIMGKKSGPVNQIFKVRANFSSRLVAVLRAAPVEVRYAAITDSQKLKLTAR